MSESTSKLLTEAFEHFKAGYALKAANILQKYAQKLSSEASRESAQSSTMRERSDAIAALGIKLLVEGDIIERQEYAANTKSWQKKKQSFEAGFEKLEELVQIFAELYERTTAIVHEDDRCMEFISRIASNNLLEQRARGYDQALSDEDRRQYLLGQAQQDIKELYNYAFELNNEYANHLIHRRIREGEKHEHLAILMELTAYVTKYEELKSLQERLTDFIQNSPSAPLPPAILGRQLDIFVELSKLAEEEQANT